MKYIFLIAATLMGMPTMQSEVDVPAYKYVTPPSHSCNVPTTSGDGRNGFSVCITQDETHYTCQDKSRVLLESEDGEKHCIDFKLLRSR